jgi:selenocysteine lyase/cysteine desulfurase
VPAHGVLRSIAARRCSRARRHAALAVGGGGCPSLTRMDASALRAEFPVLADRAYLNAGTCGPLPHAAVRASLEMLDRGASEGRAKDYVEALIALRDRQRAAYAATLGADAADVALTTCTSDGVVRVLAGLELGPGDEVLTAPDEHPGLLGPLTTLRERRGVNLRTVPFADLADAVGPQTRLVACSHVSWVTGALRPEGLAALDVPVLLDGAQGVGAIHFDVAALGCAFYAGSGQKWLCGPIGSGMLWVAADWHERLAPIGVTYLNLEDPADGLDSRPWSDARRYDAPGVSGETLAAAVAAHDLLAGHGWPEVHARAAGLASLLAERLASAGRTVAPRGDTTLVSWEDTDPEATRDRLFDADVVVRHLPGTPYVRASVGAWNDEDDLERLLAAL